MRSMKKENKETKGLWMGKPIEKYTKPELIDIIVELGKKYTEALEKRRNL